MWIFNDNLYEYWDETGFAEIITSQLPEGETAQTPVYFWQLKKIAEIKQYYDQLSQTFTYQGHTYQTDVTAKERLMAELQMLSVREDPSPWRDSDNQMVSFSNLEFETFCRGVYQYHKTLILTSFSHIDQVRALQTVEEVNNYDYTFTL